MDKGQITLVTKDKGNITANPNGHECLESTCQSRSSIATELITILIRYASLAPLAD